MKIFILLIFIFQISFLNLQDSTSKDSFNVEIEQINFLSGNNVKYSYTGNSLGVYKKIFNIFFIRKNRIKMSNDDVEKLNSILSEAYMNSTIEKKYYSDDTILDGFSWDVRVFNKTGIREFSVTNCYHEDLDKIVGFINSKLDKKKRLIIKSGLIYN